MVDVHLLAFNMFWIYLFDFSVLLYSIYFSTALSDIH